jgi:glyceraldehyde-3-phosphate dehydrogenase (NAD(P))
LPKTIPAPAKTIQIGRVLAAEQEEFQDEGYKGAEEPF